MGCMQVANAVVNADNASLATMNTTQVLDLLSLQPSSGDGQKLDTPSGQGLEAGALLHTLCSVAMTLKIAA